MICILILALFIDFVGIFLNMSEKEYIFTYNNKGKEINQNQKTLLLI